MDALVAAALGPVAHENFKCLLATERLVGLEAEVGFEDHSHRHQVELVVIDAQDRDVAVALGASLD